MDKLIATVVTLVTFGPLLVLPYAYAERGFSAKEVAKFRKNYACPSTKKYTGDCPGYIIDYVKPRCVDGTKESSNMRWVPSDIGHRKRLMTKFLCDNQHVLSELNLHSILQDWHSNDLVE